MRLDGSSETYELEKRPLDSSNFVSAIGEHVDHSVLAESPRFVTEPYSLTEDLILMKQIERDSQWSYSVCFSFICLLNASF